MIIDKQGRIAGKVSLIDIAVALVIVGLIAGFGYRRVSGVAKTIVNTNTKFYVTLEVQPLRQFSLDAINLGDIFYKQHEQLPLGKVTALSHEQAKNVIDRPDGTAAYVPIENKFVLYITLECAGNVSDSGYYVNGSSQIAAGSDMIVQSNMVICGARVKNISTNLGG